VRRNWIMTLSIAMGEDSASFDVHLSTDLASQPLYDNSINNGMKLVISASHA
jgi:hypothetical protein